MGSIRVAIAGVGNCASSLLQGLKYYGDDDSRPGLWHRFVGGYRVKDIRLVEAFDINSRKVGREVSEAIFMEPNVARKYVKVESLGVGVRAGILMDRLPEKLKELIRPTEKEEEDLAEVLKESKVEVFVNLISSGLEASSKAYAEAALEAGCCFLNATPASIASREGLAERFEGSGLLVVGDDLMSQFGGTAFHKGILELMERRGIKVVRGYQLDVGGGAETLNTLDDKVRALKRSLKTEAVASELPYKFEVVAGTTDYDESMGNERVSYFWKEGEGFLGSKVFTDIYLRTSDGPNSGNILLDVIRAVKAAKEGGRFGAPLEICGYGFKKTLRPVRLHDAYLDFSASFLKGS